MNVKISGIEQPVIRLNQLQSGEPMRRGLMAGGVYLRGKWAIYPPERHGPQPFKTDAQRRAFFAKLRAGAIIVPYPRGTAPNSQRTSTRWGEVMQGNSVIVGNSANNAPLLYSKSQQSMYHKQTGWKTDEQIWNQEKAATRAVIVAEVKKG